MSTVCGYYAYAKVNWYMPIHTHTHIERDLQFLENGNDKPKMGNMSRKRAPLKRRTNHHPMLKPQSQFQLQLQLQFASWQNDEFLGQLAHG